MPTDPVTWFLAVGQRYTKNLMEIWDELTMQKWIRVVIIVCAYLLLRPYLIKFGGSEQMKQHEREEAEAHKRAALTPNDLRGGRAPKTAKVSIPGEDDADIVEASASDWGTKARKRQRGLLKKMLEVEEKRLEAAQGDDEDKDIEEFLEK